MKKHNSFASAHYKLQDIETVCVGKQEKTNFKKIKIEIEFRFPETDQTIFSDFSKKLVFEALEMSKSHNKLVQFYNELSRGNL